MTENPFVILKVTERRALDMTTDAGCLSRYRRLVRPMRELKDVTLKPTSSLDKKEADFLLF